MKGERLSIYRLQLSFRSRSKLKNEATSLLAVADSLPGTHAQKDDESRRHRRCSMSKS